MLVMAVLIIMGVAGGGCEGYGDDDDGGGDKR